RRLSAETLGDGAALAPRGPGQIERTHPDFDLGSRPQNKPTAHDVRMQGAHEDRCSPERNAAADKPVAQLCKHLVSLHCRSRTIDEPIHNRPYVTTRHHTQPSRANCDGAASYPTGDHEQA